MPETKTCEECLGEGKNTVDFNDPGDHYGHGQYEEKCGGCEGAGEVKVEQSNAAKLVREMNTTLRKLYDSVGIDSNDPVRNHKFIL